MGWVYVPGLTDSNSDSKLLSEMPTGLSLQWNTKPLRPAPWRRVCKTAPYLSLLSGTIFEPSTLDRGAESYRLSLAESPVSLTPSLANGSAPKTSVTSGPTRSESLESASQIGFSSKMFPEQSHTSTTTSCPDCKRWATQLRRYSLRQRTLVRHTAAKGSSSWPTPQTMQAPNSNANQKYLPASLEGAAANWPTTCVTTTGGPKGLSGGSGNSKKYKEIMANWPIATAEDAESSQARREKDVTLTEAAKLWSTPQEDDANNAFGRVTGAQQSLARDAVNHWQTPSDPTFKMRRQQRQTERTEALLPMQAEQWQTPASDSFRHRGGDRVGEMGLDQQARFWATPTSRDHKDGANPSEAVPTNSLLGRQAPRIMLDGNESLPSDPTSRPRRKLNPKFVAWLMDFPEGWLELNSSAYSETQSWLLRRRQRLRYLLGASE